MPSPFFLLARHTLLGLGLLLAAAGLHSEPAIPSPLAGTWVLADAYEIKPDGARTYPYGEHPVGLLLVDVSGRYSLQIFRPDRPKFAASDKAHGTADEYRAATVGISTHIGRCELDAAQGMVIFRIEHASYPNLEGTTQRRVYQLSADEFSYRIPTQASGNVPVSVWHRQP